jgi:hypothetical protein
MAENPHAFAERRAAIADRVRSLIRTAIAIAGFGSLALFA